MGSAATWKPFDLGSLCACIFLASSKWLMFRIGTRMDNLLENVVLAFKLTCKVVQTSKRFHMNADVFQPE